jgi:hypothetical protein
MNRTKLAAAVAEAKRFIARAADLDLMVAKRLEKITEAYIDKEITTHYEKILAKLKGALT